MGDTFGLIYLLLVILFIMGMAGLSLWNGKPRNPS